MSISPRTVLRLGVAFAVLASCTQTEPTRPASTTPSNQSRDAAGGAVHAANGGAHDARATHDGPETAADDDGKHHAMETLPIEHRLAFMSGHVEAGLALYRAGAPDQAAPHLLHPVSETHAAERAGIDALGFQAGVFETVSKALADGRAAAEIETQLKEAEANMAVMQEKAGGDPNDIIEYLMETVVEEYAVGVQEGRVTDPGEYQDAYGFAVVALKTAKRSNAPELVIALEALVAMWPAGGPLADSKPQAAADVTAQATRVMKVLSASR